MNQPAGLTGKRWGLASGDVINSGHFVALQVVTAMTLALENLAYIRLKGRLQYAFWSTRLDLDEEAMQWRL
jgi:hypothetical protein